MNLMIMLNSFSFALAYTIIAKKFLDDRSRLILPLFGLIFITETLFKLFIKEYISLSFYINILFVTFIVNKMQKDFIKSLNYAISALCLLHIFVTLSGSLFILTTPIKNTYDSLFFNLLMQVGIILYSTSLAKFNIVELINPNNNRCTKFNLVNNISFFIFINYIMTFFYQKMGREIYYLICSIFILFDLFTKLILIFTNKMHLDISLREQELQFLQTNSENIKKKDFEIVKIKDFTSEMAVNFTTLLNKKDTVGIVNYLDEKITPMYAQYLAEKTMFKQVELIYEPLIKGLIYEFLQNLSKKKAVSINLDIMPNSTIPEKNLLLIYRAIELFLNDAYEELSKINNGHTHLKLYSDSETFKFSLDNYLGKVTRKESTINSTKNNNLKDILKKNPNIMELSTVKDSGFFFQRIIVNINE